MASLTRAALPWMIGAALAAALATSRAITAEQMALFSTPLLIGVLLTVLATYFGVLLSQGELSASHVGGMIALLAAGGAALPLLTWAIFGASIVSVIALRLRGRIHPSEQTSPPNLVSSLLLTARLTLSLWTAGQVYHWLADGQPLRTLADVADNLVVLSAFIMVYIAVYLLIYLVEVARAELRFQREDVYRIVVVTTLPVPFVVLGAEILNQLAPSSQVIFVLGLMFIIIALHGLSRSEFQMRRQLNESRTMSVISRAMRSHLELDALLRTLYIQIAHLLEVDNFTAVLRDPTSQTLRYALVIRQGKEHIEVVEQPIKDENALIARVVRDEAPLLLRDEIFASAQSMGLTPPDAGVMSWLGVPLQAGGKVLGAIAILSRTPRRHFNNNDLHLLSNIAISSSIAVENAMLYQQQKARTEQLITLNRVSAVLGRSLSFEDVTEAVISAASMLTHAHAIALYLYWDDARTTLSLAHSGGLSNSFLVDAPDPLMQLQDAPYLQPIAVENVREDKRIQAARQALTNEGIVSYLEMPLVTGENTLGVLVLYYHIAQTFDGDSIELYKTFTTQAAQAIVNARTFTSADEAFQRSSEQLGSLSEIGRLLTSRVNLKDVCELVLSYATSATDVKRGLVALIDEQSKAIEVMAAHGYGDILALTTLEYTEPTIASNISSTITRLALNGSQTRKTETHSVLAVPIRLASEAIGIVQLEADRYRDFTAEDIHFVEQIANQGVIAIENARLFDRIAKDRDRLQVLLDAMEEGIIAINHEKVITLANPHITLVGLDPESLLGQKLTEMTPEAGAQLALRTGFANIGELIDLMANPDALNAAVPTNYVVQGTQGDLSIRRQIVPIKDADGTIYGALLVLYNKTEEEELARSREELSSMIVHDLRSPLTAVTTSLKLLSDHVPKDVPFYRLVETTTDASRRAVRKMMRRVDSLLDISKMESGQVDLDQDTVRLEELVENVFTDVRPLAQELDISLKKNLSPSSLLLYVDADKTERLLQNLLDNALKYNQAEQDIIVKSYAPGDNGAAPGYVRIDVIDRGPGVPADYREKLFAPFVQIEGRRKVRRGVGLGLAFCRLVVIAHGGRIWIEDNPEGGSVFAFTLPAAVAEATDESV